MITQRVLAAATIVLAVLFAGCARSPQARFYTLAPAATAAPPASATPGPAVVVGPISIPEVVDRPQLVVHVGENRVEVLESQRWAEPLKAGIPRALALDLGRLLGSSRVYSYQELTGASADWRVLLDLVRFESLPGDSVTVEADWSVRRTGGAPLHGHSVVRQRVSGAGYDALVAAYSRAIGSLSADIAKAIRGAGAPN